ncbi:MAG: hypothetical protein ACKOED_12395 [Aestuariivirga sp.]|uniref:hypothetical protein n=1 Tax=Aestuariivirga sp. TaxID=2650926 RepID=UPI0038D0F8DF
MSGILNTPWPAQPPAKSTATAQTGQRPDTVGGEPLIGGIELRSLIAGKAFESNWIITALNARSARMALSQRLRRRLPFAIDGKIYKSGHLIENALGKLKEFKRIGMRAPTNDSRFAAMTDLVSSVINSRRISTGPSL